MKVFNVSIMLSVQLTYILLFLSLCAFVFSFPSTPLNERSQEISWQAWLLVDDQNQQNQNRQSGDGVLPRRRITPKSVFVAPSFSPENLPACAEGYSSDAMGRCIKIIKLDEDRHLEFLVSKLNDKFGVVDYEEEIEEIDSMKSEPFQLSIPLSIDDTDYSNDTPQEDLDFAIIVTPTTRDSDQSKDDGTKVDKRNDQNMADIYEKELKKLLKVTTIKTYDDTTRNENFETTAGVSEDYTFTESDGTEATTTLDTVTDIETTTIVTSTVDAVDETTTMEELNQEHDHYVTESSEDVDTTTSTEPTTTLEGTTEEVTTIEHIKLPKTTPKITTSTVAPKITTYHPKVFTYRPYFDINVSGNSKTKNLIKFPEEDEEPAIPRNHPDGDFVRFPDADAKFQQESQVHRTRDVNDQSGNYFNEIVTSEPSQRVQETVLPPKEAYKGQFSGFFPSEARHLGPDSSAPFKPKFFPSREVSDDVKGSRFPLIHPQNYQYHAGATTEKYPAKKTREKHGSMLVLPPRWSQNNHQKPLVLRFSRKHFNVDTNKFKNNEFYRSLPMDDLSFLFGYKHGQTSHR